MSKPLFAMIDDFFPNPEAVFNEIVFGSFEPYKSVWDGVFYPGINQQIPTGIQNFVLMRLEQIFNKKIKGVCFARAMLDGMIAPHRIHSDKIMGESSMHIYLSKEWPAGSGTSFWEHKTEGKSHTDQTKVDVIDRDHDTPEMWERDLLACAKFNRAVIHDACLFHAAEPREGWGDRPSNGRLVLTTFFSEEK